MTTQRFGQARWACAVLARSRSTWFAAAMLLGSAVASPASADLVFSASADGTVRSRADSQSLAGVLQIAWNNDSTGSATAMLAQMAQAEYTFTQFQTPTGTETATFMITFSFTGNLIDPDGMGLKFKFDPTMMIMVSVDMAFAPSYTLEQMPFSVFQSLSAEALSVKVPDVQADGPNPAMAEVSGSVQAMANGAGTAPGYSAGWALSFDHQVFQNGVQLLDPSGGWSLGSNSPLTTSGFVDPNDIMITGSQIMWTVTRSFDVELNQQRVTVATLHNMNASATLVPEPSSLTLLGFGSLSLAAYGWRRRRHG